MLRNSVEEPKESKFSPTHFLENTDFNGLSVELARPIINHLENGVILKREDEDNPEYIDIDIIHEEVKPQICEAKSNGKSENAPNLNFVANNTGTEIGPSFSRKLPIDSNKRKRKRDPPFQPAEKNNLIDLVTKYFAIIECKRTDSVSTKAKNEQWSKIAREFNATSSFMDRDWQVLKNLWENLKKKTKSSITQQTQEMFATGGGPPKKMNDDPILERVIGLIRSNVQGFKNPFDSDAYTSVHHEDENPAEIPDENRENNNQYEGDDWSNYTPQMPRTPRSAPLRENDSSNLGSATFEVVDILNVDSQQSVSTFEATQQSTIPAGPAVFQDYRTPTVALKSGRHVTSRRRPVLKQAEADLLAKAKIKTLAFCDEQALQQHEVTMKILSLQEAQEKEKLKQEIEKTEQEKLRTELLRKELSKVDSNFCVEKY
ncbi:hypothetical protein JTB14_002478 [Gonioctena quinquepunctata]|nr:hypothetical protein JTB14_002478 [Gonioctena quinquepunctata]